MSALDDLLDGIFGEDYPALREEFEEWARGSRRYRAFATEYRSKIRAKLRNARDESGLEDVRAELATAALLLGDNRFTLEYERYAALKQRGPDFTVTFRTRTPFNVEVRRLRPLEMSPGDAADAATADAATADAATAKLTAILFDKVGQMPPSSVNLLWLIAERPLAAADLEAATLLLRQQAARKEEEHFTRRGFESAADFLRQYQRLSGAIIRPTGHAGRIEYWPNTIARHKTPAEVVTALQRLEAK